MHRVEAGELVAEEAGVAGKELACLKACVGGDEEVGEDAGAIAAALAILIEVLAGEVCGG